MQKRNDDAVLKAAINAGALIAAFYEWIERIEKCGGATTFSGIAECHAMLMSMKKNRAKIDESVIKPLAKAIQDQAASQDRLE